MRVLYFYCDYFGEAVRALPPGTELIYTGVTPYDWWNEFRVRWGTGDDIVTIDQDVVLVPDVVQQFDACPEPWCVFPYPYWHDQFLCHSCGCTRFRKEVQGALRHADMEMTWNHYDGDIRSTMHDQGYGHPHVHFPPLRHLHPGLPMPEDPVALWHQMFDDPHYSGCRGDVVRIGDSDSGVGTDTA